MRFASVCMKNPGARVYRGSTIRPTFFPLAAFSALREHFVFDCTFRLQIDTRQRYAKENVCSQAAPTFWHRVSRSDLFFVAIALLRLPRSFINPLRENAARIQGDSSTRTILARRANRTSLLLHRT